MDDAFRRGQRVAEIDPSAHAADDVGGKMNACFFGARHAQVVDDTGVSRVRSGSEGRIRRVFGISDAQRFFAAEQVEHVLKAFVVKHVGSL